MWFPGYTGVAVGLGTFAAIWVIVWLRTEYERYTFEANDGDVEKQLLVYLDIAKFILSLAAGGIVLIISSTALGSTHRLPLAYASPLFILVMSIFYGILFMPLIALDYETFRHDARSYTKPKYVRNQALGFAALGCFCVGYAWLIIAAVRS